MDFSGNIIHSQAAADMSSADLFDYLLSTDNDATFSSFYPPDTLLPISHQTVLPAVQQPIAPSFSYRQISPSMPPPNPPTTAALAHIAIAPAPVPAPAIAIAPARPAVHIKPILPKTAPKAAPSTASCIATATAVTTSASTLINPALFTPGSSIPSSSTSIPVVAAEDIWKERFQQLQQLQQTHRHKQHQLLSAAIFNSPTTSLTSSTLPPVAAATVSSSSSSRTQKSSSSSSSQRGSSSERSVSPEKTDKLRTIYPSPPMNDDMAMESDSEARFGLGSDFTKPTESQLKLMTSKERRQLRNKLSARNFRVRRKEYIDELENQVKEAKREAADIQRRLIQSELNCQFLRQELEATRLSQSLFGAGSDGRMSKEHANLLASLLNPNTETFPSVSSTNNPIAPVQLTSEQLSSASWMDTSLANAVSAAPTAAPAEAGAIQSTTTSEEGQVPMEPFVPFDGDWSGLLINRAEVSEAMVDPKDASTGVVAAAPGDSQGPAHELLARYEALKREAEMDAQMRAEIKADTERRLLAQTYMVIPKEDATSDDVRHRLEEESVVLKSLIYMLMVQLTGSLIEAATLSKTDLVRMYQAMDEPLRAKMLAQAKEQDCSTTSRFMEWREGWIKRCWPSYYNNRRRIVELINRTGICDPCHNKDKDCTSNDITREMKEKEIIEIARKMEEGVRGLTVEVNGQEIQMCKSNFFYRTFMPDRFKCAGVLAWEKLDAEVKAIARASKSQQQQQQTVGSLSMPMPMPMPMAAGIACA